MTMTRNLTQNDQRMTQTEEVIYFLHEKDKCFDYIEDSNSNRLAPRKELFIIYAHQSNTFLPILSEHVNFAT